MEKYIFELKMKVRDYECDLQGIVNNANYQHYIEHTRHEFLSSVGVSFAQLHQQGIDPVVARLNMAFKTPLTSGDEFISRLALRNGRHQIRLCAGHLPPARPETRHQIDRRNRVRSQRTPE